MSKPQLQLSVSASTGQKVAASVFGLVFLTVLAGITGIAYVIVGGFSDPSSDDFTGFPFDATGSDDQAETIFVAVVTAVGAIMAILVVLMVLSTYRRRAVLDGTVLRVRDTFTARDVDLATARVWLDSEPELVDHGERSVPSGRRVPRLVSEDPHSGRKVRLRLHGTGRTLLPPHELHALADAVDSGVRDEPEAARAAATASLLRRLADDPIARLL